VSSEFEHGLAPVNLPTAEQAKDKARHESEESVEWVDINAVDPKKEEFRLKTGRYSFSQAIAIIERHRRAVQATVGAALLGRLLLEFQLLTLLGDPPRLVAAVPHIGLALLAYLLVLWFMAVRTRDRYAFGMALGVGVLQGTYAIAQAVMLNPRTLSVAFSWSVVALAHGLMAGAALHASTAYPPFDTKRPWMIGFVTAVALLALSWLAPLIM
jgi:hypothetical protein